MHRRRALAVLLAASGVLGAACGGGGSTTSTDPATLLVNAKKKVDAAPAIHFALSSENAGGTDVYLKGGSGDAARPDGFAGTFDVYYHIGVISIGVVSVGGTFSVRLPFVNTWEKTDPSKYGFSDPGKLIDPQAGLSSLLARYHTVSLDSNDRYQGEELQEVHVTLPGDLVGALLTSADTSKDVDGEVGIAVASGEVRRVKLTGPFFQKGQNSTYTVILSNYGESVTVTPPPA